MFGIIMVQGANGQLLEVLLQLDGMPGPEDGWQSIDDMGTMGLDEKIEGRWWVTKWDAVANRYVIAYTNDNFQEPYKKKLRLTIRNNSGGPLTIERWETKRKVICEVPFSDVDAENGGI